MSQYMARAAIRFPPLLVLVILFCVPAHAKRHDIVVMKNGDRITGEVKKLENGILYIEPEYVSSSFGVDWFQVASIQSTASYQVVMKNGDRVVGTIEKVSVSETPGADFKIHDGDREVSAVATNVVQIESKKKTFLQQLTGAIDLGYNFTSGNSQTQVSSDASANYLSTKWSTGASLTSSFSGQSGAAKTNLFDGTATSERFFNRNSSLLGLADFLHSSQQDLDLRETFGGGYSPYWIRTNQAIFRGIFGVAYVHESFTSALSNLKQQNVEALVGVQYQLFHFSRYSLLTQFFAFPGLSDTGRVLTTTKTTFSVKLVNNFYNNFSFWDNFDSRPPINTAKKNELGVSNSIGWKF